MFPWWAFASFGGRAVEGGPGGGWGGKDRRPIEKGGAPFANGGGGGEGFLARCSGFADAARTHTHNVDMRRCLNGSNGRPGGGWGPLWGHWGARSVP